MASKTRTSFYECMVKPYLDHGGGSDDLGVDAEHGGVGLEELGPPLGLEAALHLGQVQRRLRVDVRQVLVAGGHEHGEVPG